MCVAYVYMYVSVCVCANSKFSAGLFLTVCYGVSSLLLKIFKFFWLSWASNLQKFWTSKIWQIWFILTAAKLGDVDRWSISVKTSSSRPGNLALVFFFSKAKLQRLCQHQRIKFGVAQPHRTNYSIHWKNRRVWQVRKQNFWGRSSKRCSLRKESRNQGHWSKQSMEYTHRISLLRSPIQNLKLQNWSIWMLMIELPQIHPHPFVKIAGRLCS